ncbi:hypothetical protein [Halomonas lysinitropha]|uniref:hypothetical protein n=1 Tax=Halomonas lysinitropha TaxID=2607506 RepID=UPI00124A1A9D|nr:hypothetical protein [Halomonas lysinitropha]
MARNYQRMHIWELRELAREQHPDHDPEATRVFVTRILDMEAERRTLYGDEHLQGYGGSPIAPGWAPGSTDIAREPLAMLYDRGIYTHEQHETARRWVAAARLPSRQLLAALIQARKLHGNGNQYGTGKEWIKSYDQIAGNLGHYAQLLGMPPGSPPAHTFDCIDEEKRTKGSVRVRRAHQVMAFRNGQAIKDAAKSAKAALIMLAKR